MMTNHEVVGFPGKKKKIVVFGFSLQFYSFSFVLRFPLFVYTVHSSFPFITVFWRSQRPPAPNFPPDATSHHKHTRALGCCSWSLPRYHLRKRPSRPGTHTHRVRRTHARHFRLRHTREPLVEGNKRTTARLFRASVFFFSFFFPWPPTSRSVV